MSRLQRFTEALAAAFDSSEVSPRSTSSRSYVPYYSGPNRPRATPSRGDRGDLARMRRLANGFPPATAAFDQFSDDVLADGYEIEAADPETEQWLSEWASGCVIAGAQRGADLRELLHAIPREFMVPGTALIELAPSRGAADRLAGFSLIRPETVTTYTDPRSGLLVAPEDADRLDDVKVTDEGHAAAFAQNPDTRDERLFSQEDVLKIDRSPEPGDIWGRSSLEPAADRIESLIDQLEKTDDAVARKAWGTWVYQCGPTEVSDGMGGTELEQWDSDEVREFAKKARALEPGESLALSGDISLEQFNGEVPEIIDLLGWEMDFILSALPCPKYMIAFGQDLNQFTTEHQERAHRDRVASMRQRIEKALTPVLKRVARERGLSDAGVSLSLSTDEGTTPRTSSPREVNTLDFRHEAASDALAVADPRPDIEEEYEALQETIADYLTEYRGRLVDAGREGPAAVEAVSIDLADVREEVRREIENATQAAVDDLQVPPEDVPVVDTAIAVSAGTGAASLAVDEIMATIEARAEDMRQSIAGHVRRGRADGVDYETVAETIREEHSEPKITTDGGVIARNNAQAAVNRTRIDAWRETDGVVGVEVANPLDTDTTRLCRGLATAPATAYFDREESIDEQLREFVDEETLFGGFTLAVPPFHHRCRSWLLPITD